MGKKAMMLFFLIFITIVSTSCGNVSDKPVEQEAFYMGTIISEKVYGTNAQKAADQVMAKMADIEHRMTINAAGSEIDKLNQLSGKENVSLSKDIIHIMETAKKIATQSEGAFDITIGPLVKAWGVFTDNPRVPGQDEINKLKDMVNYNDLSFNKENNSAKLARPGQIVDLGGIAKGYAGDAAIEIYKANGIKSAYINLGGNVVTLGNKPDGTPWKIGVQNPRAENGKYIGILNISNKAVVSSGDYERYFEKDGKRYHHIIDPRTGYPSDSGLIGTTIVADSSMDADALSTSTFVLGLDKGMELIEQLNGVEAIFITKDKKVYITPGLKESFTFDDESKEFRYVEKR